MDFNLTKNNGTPFLPNQSEVPGGVSPPTTAPVKALEAERLPEAGYTHSATVWISPRILRWVAPVMGVALFILLFLPWTGAYPGGIRVYSQNAFQTIWGGVSVSPLGTEALDQVKPYGAVGANRLMLFYTLLVLSVLVLLLAPVWLTPSRVQGFPLIVRLLWRGRLELLGTMALTAFVLLIAQLWTGFGLDAAVATRADSNLASEFAAATTAREMEKANIHRGLELGTFSFGHTFWLHLAVFSHALLLVCLVLELWLAWRGNRPLPRIDGHA